MSSIPHVGTTYKTPNYDARQRPNNCNANQHRVFKKQAQRQQQISDVTHPEHVAEFIDLPVVNRLCSEETEREKSQQTQLLPRQISSK